MCDGWELSAIEIIVCGVIDDSYILQTLLGTPRVTDLNIMLRILQEGDLRCKTEDATTFLHESVRYALPPVFVARLFSLDCPLEEREKDGLTARQLAVRAGNQPLVQVH